MDQEDIFNKILTFVDLGNKKVEGGFESSVYSFLIQKSIKTTHMGQVPQDGNFAQNVALFSKK